MNRLYVCVFLWMNSLALGQTWIQTSYNVGGPVHALVTDQTNRVCAGSNNGRIHWTTDQGANWTMVNFDFGSVNALATSINTGWVFCGTYAQGVYRTINKTSWTAPPTLPGRNIRGIAVKSGYVFALVQTSFLDTLYKSQDNGGSWNFVRYFDNAFTCYVDDGGVLYVGSNEGVWYSPDNGNGWYNAGLTSYRTTAIVVGASSHIIAGTEQHGIHVTTDLGSSWTQALGPVGEITSFVKCSVSEYLAGTLGNGVFRSTDSGLHWTQWSDGLADNLVYSMTQDLNGYVYAGHTNTISKSTEPCDVEQLSTEIPQTARLFQNYPNPFNPNTSIQFQVHNSGFVELSVFDILGHKVATLMNEKLPVGTYAREFDGSGLTSGIYFYRVTMGKFTETKKMMLVR
ncbi:MAG: T9SS type A sorting domain-containing protein [Bacteroidota bacterium]